MHLKIKISLFTQFCMHFFILKRIKMFSDNCKQSIKNATNNFRKTVENSSDVHFEKGSKSL